MPHDLLDDDGDRWLHYMGKATDFKNRDLVALCSYHISQTADYPNNFGGPLENYSPINIDNIPLWETYRETK